MSSDASVPNISSNPARSFDLSPVLEVSFFPVSSQMFTVPAVACKVNPNKPQTHY